jgi:hypothetical protein
MFSDKARAIPDRTVRIYADTVRGLEQPVYIGLVHFGKIFRIYDIKLQMAILQQSVFLIFFRRGSNVNAPVAAGIVYEFQTTQHIDLPVLYKNPVEIAVWRQFNITVTGIAAADDHKAENGSNYDANDLSEFHTI